MIKSKFNYVAILISVFSITVFSFVQVQNCFGAGDNAGDADELKFVFKSGEEGYACFRIPSIITTSKGIVLAFAEARKINCGDAGDIDLVLKSSVNGGKTWSPLQVVWDDAENTCGNPVPVQDEKTGKIILLSTWNLGTDHEKEIIGFTSKDTRRVFMLSSADEGKSWTSPKDITTQTKKPDWTWYATGPCHGIQIKNGRYKGRIVVPVNHIEKNTNKDYSHIIYSDDSGASWHIGNSTPQDFTNESTVAEISKGRLMLNMRNYDRTVRYRQVTISKNGGQTWEDIAQDTTLIEPVCQASLLRYPSKGKKAILLFSNPASKVSRTNLTLRLSKDDGKTWVKSQVLYAGPSAYSDITVLPDGNIGCYFEAGTQKPYEGIVFQQVNYNQLIN